jgi:hypothetical protein
MWIGLAVAGCTKPEAAPTDARASSPPTPMTRASDPREDDREAGSPCASDASFDGGSAWDAFATWRPVRGKSVGHTSVVFKLRLGAPPGGAPGATAGVGAPGWVEAAYKPRSKRGKTRYRGEIAAYRLGRALGIENVPLAMPRAFLVSELAAALGGSETAAGKLLADEVVADARGEVRGALIPWIAGLQFLALDAEPLRSEWRTWLARTGSVPEGRRKRAAQISTMIVFDYLTGNWDRWSGGNIGTDETGETLLYIDNDGAFFDPPPPEPLARQRALLREDARFSRSFVDALRRLEPEVARAALGEDAPGEPLLSSRILAGLEERRKEVLAMVDADVIRDGQDKVLAFE